MKKEQKKSQARRRKEWSNDQPKRKNGTEKQQENPAPTMVDKKSGKLNSLKEYSIV